MQNNSSSLQLICGMETLIHPITQSASATFFIDYGQVIPSFYSTMLRYKTIVIETFKKENGKICYLFTGDILCENKEREFEVSFDVSPATQASFDALREENDGNWTLLVASSTVVEMEVNAQHHITKIQERPRADFF